MRKLSVGVATALVTGLLSIGDAPVKGSVSTGSPLGYRPATHNMYGVNNVKGLTNHSVEAPAGTHVGSGTLAHQRMREAGVGWVRYWLSWAQVEGGGNNVYDWAQADHDINAAIAEGLNIYITIQTAPAWVHGGKQTYGWGYCGGESGIFDPTKIDCQPAGSLNPYAPFDPPVGGVKSPNWRDFVAAAVQRYSDRVQYWGFWNEPDSQWMWPEYVEAPCYDRAKQLVDKVIKPGREAALATNPNVIIVGPDDNSPNSLEQFLRLERDGMPACGVAPYGRLFDVLSIHAYNQPPGYAATLDAFKQKLDLFDRREVWLTELPGDATVSASLTEFLMRGWISKAFVYSMRGNACGGYDLLDINMLSCPSYSGLQTTISNNKPAMHFAGTTGVAGHDDFVLLLNPHATATTTTVWYSTASGSTQSRNYYMGPYSRLTRHVRTEGGINGNVAQAVTVWPDNPSLPIWAEHADYWNSLQAGRLSQGTGERSDTWYFAEGAQGAGFWTHSNTAYNPSPTNSVNVTWTFLNASGTTVPVSQVIPPRGHHRVNVNGVPGVEGTHSTIVSGKWTGGTHHDKPAPIIAERTMSWNGEIEGHSGRGAPFTSTEWYFAEGTQTGDWHTYLLLMNPTNRSATVDIRYMLPTGISGPQPIVTVPALSRVTVEAPPLGEFGIIVKSIGTSPVPIVAERAIYMGAGFPIGHLTEGASKASMRWMLPEASTEGNRFYDPYILIANPSPNHAQVRLNFRKGDGSTHSEVISVGAGARVTFVTWNYPQLRNHTFATEVISEMTGTPGWIPAGIVVERSMYWDGGTGNPWYGAHSAIGIP